MFFDTRTTQREGQLVMGPVREHRVVGAFWREDGTLGQAKVVAEIGGHRFVVDLRIADGITPVLVDQTCIVTGHTLLSISAGRHPFHGSFSFSPFSSFYTPPCNNLHLPTFRR